MAEKRVEFKGTKVEVLEKRLAKPIVALKQIGVHLVSVTQKAFREQRRGRFRWPERWNPNIPAVLRDLSGGASVKRWRFQGRPALVDTGRLRNSISFRFIGDRKIEFGTNVPYANVHQQGGSRTIQITDTMRRNLGKYLKRNRDKSADLGWLFNEPGPGPNKRRNITFTVRQRPFILFTEEDRKAADRIIKKVIRGEATRP